MEEVCFARDDFNLYLLVLVCLLLYFFYILYICRQESLTNVDLTEGISQKELKNRVAILQDQLYASRVEEQKCRSELAKEKDDTRDVRLNRIYNPLIGPARLYPGGRLNTRGVNDYQIIGFLYNESERYPLFGRPKYYGKSDKWEYYAIDETRNRLKLPFSSRNDNELYDGDVVSIPGAGNNYTVKLYEYDQFRYNPDV